MADSGKVAPRPAGTWAAGTSYEILDFVYFGGNSYICKAAVSGSVDPTNDSTHWQQMASGFDSDLITQTITNDPNHIASDAAVYAECQKLETADSHFRNDMAHVEASAEASIVYHAGDYLMYDDQLYKATAAIAIGDTLSTATNIRAVTVGEQLADLATAGSANTAAISKYAADLAVLSTSPTTRSFAVGEYLMYNNQLYRVTQAIASGGTLTVGTNIVAANVGAQLKSLNDSLTPLTSVRQDSTVGHGIRAYKVGRIVMLSFEAMSATQAYAANAAMCTLPDMFIPIYNVSFLDPLYKEARITINADGTISSSVAVSSGAKFRGYVTYIAANNS